MPRHKEVNSLLDKMSHESSPSEVAASKLEHHLLPDLDIAAYKRARAWPGKSYMLMGNSFNLEPEHDPHKRAVAVTGLFDRAKTGMSTVADALNNDEFNQVLSRFERDWLARLKPETLIGPAFNHNGRALETAFAVWRPVRVMESSKILVQV